MAATVKMFVALSLFVLVLQGQRAAGRSFSIDYDNNTFLKDGEPFRYISGSIHYSRVPRSYWQDRLTKMYAAGLNAIQTCTDPAGAFKGQRKHQPKGPLVNSEFYTGWLDHWGQPHAHTDKDKVATYLEKILELNASVNMYMFEGGTNFGYMNGVPGETTFRPVPTSYDYDAPLSEAGDLTDKFYSIRNVISKFRHLPPGPVPPATPKAAYGKVQMTFEATVLDKLTDLSPDGPIRADYPITMENMQQSYGFMLYRTTLTAAATGAKLSVPGIRDRGYVMLDETPAGILSRNGPMDLNLTAQAGQVLDIVVENQGRINFGRYINDSKGIIANVTLGNDTLRSWSIYSLDIDGALPTLFSQPSNPAVDIDGSLPPLSYVLQNDIEGIDGQLTNQEKRSTQPRRSRAGQMVPSFYTGTFSIQDTPQDTFLNMRGWTKGQAFVNGFNLGRYWPVEGPQITLYVPASVLKSENNITLFELEASPCNMAQSSDADCTVEFQDRPIINATVSRHRGEKYDSTATDSAPPQLDAFVAVVLGVVFSVAYPISTVLNIMLS
uniref:Uncharacterized protein n=1 Tax=Branchiostoma floridae TaxID=7739 RepID=C3YW26_BRAFL|eukprot:XP_002599468.1 hypothetical protein BRAFLDRAFT_122758 [Branchiostoma floridae]